MGAIIGFIVFLYIVFSVVDSCKGIGDDWPVVLGAIVILMIPLFLVLVIYSLIKHFKQKKNFFLAVHAFIAEPMSSEGMGQIISKYSTSHQWQVACLRDLKTIRESIVGALSSEYSDVAENWMALLGECHERIRQLGPRRVKPAIQEQVSDLIKKVEKEFYSKVTLNVAKRHLKNAGKLKRKEAKLECLNQAKETLTEGLAEQSNGSDEIKSLLKEVIDQQRLLIPQVT